MATLDLITGVWVITCPIHGVVGAAIYMAKELADELADEHNRECE